jgi:ABC-type antimicrobial peptide transport system permease subunit
MRSLRLVWQSLRHYRRMHAGLFLGTALAAAILTGALLVGDSARYSLREQALARLGSVESAIVSGDRFFSRDLVPRLQEALQRPVAPALLLPGMAIRSDRATESVYRLNRVQVLGVEDSFWAFGKGAIPLKTGEAAVDERVASALHLRPGDTFALRIEKPSLLVRDAPLSSREEEPVERFNLKVGAVVSDAQMGRFGLSANQSAPQNVFVPLADLQERVDTAGRANLMLFEADPVSVRAAVARTWKPEDVGLRIARRGDNVLQLESDRIFLDDAIGKAAAALPTAQGTLTYLVNSIRKGDQFTPYSFMTAGAHAEGIRDDELVINSWLADALAAGPGDSVTVAYYELLPSNRLEERSRAFTVKEVLSVESLSLDKELVPEFPGLSNVESCADWKIGMPMDEALLKDKPNEQYWHDYRQTPKAFVTLAAGQAMWGNRFGRLTAVRFDAAAVDEATVSAALVKGLDPAALGLDPIPVRDAALKAVAQATDLGGLFLGMSFFLLVSALVLTGLLYGLGVQQRAGELGTLAALGFTPRRIRLLLLVETLAVCLPGVAAGAALGALYAYALLLGLTDYWSDAVGGTALQFHAEPTSFVAGASVAVVCALATAWLTLRRLLRRPARELLSADFSQDRDYRPGGRVGLALGLLAFVAAVATVGYALVRPPQDVAMPFFASGALLLLGGVLFSRHLLARAAFRRLKDKPTLLRSALLNAARRRTRSLGVVASLASGCFLVLAVSSMQRDVGADAELRSSGTGGFTNHAESTVPILDPADLSRDIPGAESLGFRVHDGDDASCLNLGRAQTPRVLGANVRRLSDLGAFCPAATWRLLETPLPDGAIPAFAGDLNTALWGLQKKADPKGGDVLLYKDDAGRDIKLKLVGTLPQQLTVFQGSILISDAAFTRLWPSDEGFRVFLLDVPRPARCDAVYSLISDFDRHGLEVVPAKQRLETFYAVERTYLAMFLALGGFGVLLGGASTGVVVLRNLYERRRELALLGALGFPKKTVFRLLLCEYGLLLAMGTLTGGVASAVAMAPALAPSGAGVDPVSRLVVFLLVFGAAALCVWAALVAGLRRTEPSLLQSE